MNGPPGVDALAASVAWWLDHPWHSIGVYFFVVFWRSFIVETIARISRKDAI